MTNSPNGEDPLILIVDEHDVPVGAESINDVQIKGLLHRIVRIMVEDEAGNLLLQKRTDDKALYPGRWDNSAAGHVDEGESYETAAKRELYEEIGLQGVDLIEVGYYEHHGKFRDRILNRFTKVYKVKVPKETEFLLEPSEVAAVQWFTVQEVRDLIEHQPDLLSDGIEDVIKRYY